MSDLQKNIGHKNLCHAVMKKIKLQENLTRNPAEEQVKKYKIKLSKWTNDDKSVYIREDLPHKIIRYSNLGVMSLEKILVLQIINQFE